MADRANTFELIDLVRAALSEDLGRSGDVTSAWTVPAEAHGRAVVVAKQHLVVSGTKAATLVFDTVDAELRIRPRIPDGSTAEDGDTVLEIEGPARSLLTAERTALNFLGHLSGIATLTRRFVDAVSGTDAKILDTRKTTPGWRALEKAAVRDGGGVNHRMGLHDMVMVKDNHIVAAGGIERAVARVRKENASGLPIEVEVSNISELERVLPLGVDRVMLDNMALGTLVEAVRRVRSWKGARPETEASGNVSLGTVRSIAETGVDYVSVGAITHSAPTADYSLRIVH